MDTPNFKKVLPSDLPEEAGIIMVLCPHGLNSDSYSLVSVEETENVRSLVEKQAVAWATQCVVDNSYLEYRVRIEPDNKKRSSICQNVRQHHNLDK